MLSQKLSKKQSGQLYAHLVSNTVEPTDRGSVGSTDRGSVEPTERNSVDGPTERAVVGSTERNAVDELTERDVVDKLADHWTAAGMPPAAIARLELSKRASRFALRHEQAVKAALTDLGLTYAEFDVLATLRRTGTPLRPSELTKSLSLTSGGTSNVLQRLTTAGYVEREPNTKDARSRWVRLTPTGEQLTDKALTRSTNALEALLAGIPALKIRAAADALREITAITDHRP
jgi:DNA-binding MarR family transcriptional regulator